MESLGGSRKGRAAEGQQLARPQSAQARPQSPLPATAGRPPLNNTPADAGSFSLGRKHSVHEIRPVSPGPRPFALTPERDARPDVRASVRSPSPARPQSAPGGGLRPVSLARPVSPGAVHGRVSLYDRTHEYLGPKVLRDWERSVTTPYRSPDVYMTKGAGQDLRTRTNLAQWLKRHPGGREPPFQLGQAGVTLDWGSAPQPRTIFRYLHDNGTIDFIAMRWGNQNHIEWGRAVRPGMMTWGPAPSEVAVAKWLPIFLEGIREYEEPYRFLAIKGSESLMLDAGDELHLTALDCVPPLRKALESREPTAVAVALELIVLALKVDPKVAEVWILQLWQFAQIMNLFIQKRYSVNLGYNSRELSSLRQLVFDALILMEENGGEHATSLIRRYCRVDPAVNAASHARRLAKDKARGVNTTFKPFTLF